MVPARISTASKCCQVISAMRPSLRRIHCSGGSLPLEGEIDGTGTERAEKRVGAEACAIHDGEPRVLAWTEVTQQGLPHERVVGAQPMRTGGDLARDGLSVKQLREVLPVHRDVDLPLTDVGRRSPAHRDRRLWL